MLRMQPFDTVFPKSIDETIEMINTILTRNSLTAKDIQFNLLVGEARMEGTRVFQCHICGKI